MRGCNRTKDCERDLGRTFKYRGLLDGDEIEYKSTSLLTLQNLPAHSYDAMWYLATIRTEIYNLTAASITCSSSSSSLVRLCVQTNLAASSIIISEHLCPLSPPSTVSTIIHLAALEINSHSALDPVHDHAGILILQPVEKALRSPANERDECVICSGEDE
jgi:hypothetical protein